MRGEKERKESLLNYIWAIKPSFAKYGIEVRRIGKRSRAHWTSITVFREEERADRRIKARRLLALIR